MSGDLPAYGPGHVFIALGGLQIETSLFFCAQIQSPEAEQEVQSDLCWHFLSRAPEQPPELGGEGEGEGEGEDEPQDMVEPWHTGGDL